MLDLICVVNDTALPGSHLRIEHGLTFWIHNDAGVLLLDTGQSGDVLFHNLDVLALDPHIVKALAISHAHYDHTGGLTALAEHTLSKLPLYANADLLRPRFSHKEGKYRSIGLPVNEKWLRAHFSLHLDDSPQQILQGVWTTGAITKHPYPLGSSKTHLIQHNSGYIADAYYDDLSIVIEVDEGLAVICGCCHAGLLNTLEQVQSTFNQPIVFIAGGTHLGSADDMMLEEIAHVIMDWGTVRHIYLNHCSGERAYNVLKSALGYAIVHPCPAGTKIDIEDDLRD